MKHSVATYLEKQSTEALLLFLQQCLNEGLWQDYAHSIPKIFQTLSKRGVQVPSHFVQAWLFFLNIQERP